MRIYLLGRRAPAKADKSVAKVLASGVIVGSSVIDREVVWEVVLEWRVGQFLGEEVDLVQE